MPAALLDALRRADQRAAAQEPLDLALVGVLAVDAAEDRMQAQVLGEGDDRLARGEAVLEAARLEAAVVEPAAEAHLVAHLVRDPHAERAQRHRDQASAPRRQDRRRSLAEQPDHLREGEDAVAGDVVDARERG